jgi:hypothetical protein
MVKVGGEGLLTGPYVPCMHAYVLDDDYAWVLIAWRCPMTSTTPSRGLLHRAGCVILKSLGKHEDKRLLK